MIAITALLFNLLLNVHCGNLPFFLSSKQRKDSDIFSSIDKSLNACDDFYNFACGPWIKSTVAPKNHPVWNKWEMTNYKIMDRLEQILISNETKSKRLQQAQNIYQACLNPVLESKYVLNDLKIVIKTFNGWPIVTPRWKESEFVWEVVLAKIIRLLGIHPLLKIHVFVDLKNTSQNALYLEQGELNLPQVIFDSAEVYKSIIETYELWIINTINYLYPNYKKKIKNDVKEIVKFEAEVAKLLLYKNKFEKISISDLSQEVPLNWMAVFGKIFYNTSVPWNSKQKLVLRNREYLQKLVELISNTKKDVVANYLIWSVVRSMSRDTTNYMRSLSFKMDKVVYAITEDMPRNYECIKTVTTYMDSHLITDYVNIYIHPEAINTTKLMINNIKTQFIETIKKTTWLDDKTKDKAVEKVAAINNVVIAPKEIENNSYRLEKLEISAKNHFFNSIQLRAFKSKLDFEALTTAVAFKWTDTLFEANAYYNVLQNTIFIPVGLLEPPFLTMSSPLVFNYGSLGTLIGHEISHALDTSGKHADKHGNIVNWWSRQATNKYNEKVRCFYKQYEKHNANNDFMIGENIADSVGLQLSYNALWSVENSKLHRYKHLKTYVDQLFFINYAQVWCEKSNDKLTEVGEHPPVRIRVQETLRNSKEFSNAFLCEVRENRCELW